MILCFFSANLEGISSAVWVVTNRMFCVQISSERRDGHRSRCYRVCVQRLSAEGAKPGSVPEHPNGDGRGQDGDLRGCGAAPPLHLPGLRSGGLSW